MSGLLSTTRRIMVKTLGTNFREVTEIQEQPLPSCDPENILVKIKYVGINAGDTSFTAGVYFTDAKPPFPCGYEGIGEVVAVGQKSTLKIGQCVAFIMFGAFSEYCCVPESRAMPVPSCDPAFLSIVLSGTTASVAFEKEADLKASQTVLVTAAAGGTGQFAVQLAKLAGCHVIGTCSSPTKVEFLKSIGCDRPINYKVENLDEVLQKEYPKGMDLVYESIGGSVFDTAVHNLATFGRILGIGLMSTYDNRGKEGLTKPEYKFHARTLITKSASFRGFALPDYPSDQPRHVGILAKLYTEGKLKLQIDKGDNNPTGPFKGLERVADAIDYMFAGNNTGKLVVEL